MISQIQASNARSLGNYALWETLRRTEDLEGWEVDDEGFASVAPLRASLWAQWVGRAIRWSLAGGVFLAYVNHWPGGH